MENIHSTISGKPPGQFLKMAAEQETIEIGPDYRSIERAFNLLYGNLLGQGFQEGSLLYTQLNLLMSKARELVELEHGKVVK